MGDNSPTTKSLKFCIQILIVGFIYGILTITESTFVFLPFPNYRPPPPCPPNEVYKSCLNNCSNCDQRGICPMVVCESSGCDCINRFVRVTPDGPCEPIYKCPVPECGENEVYRECGPICERCGTLQCRIMGCDHKCYCKEGYLRDWGGKCVLEDECLILHCPRDTEELKGTGPEDNYCVHAEGVVASNATQDKEQCYCKEGFKRSYMGHCVPEKNCPTRCMGIEDYLLCPKKCNTTCRNYGDPTCVEDGQCYPGCFCPEGYIMNDFRFCVPLDHCPPGSNPFAPTVPPTTPVELTTSPTSDIDTETTAPEETSQGEIAPEEPSLEETAPEEPAPDETAPEESALDETAPEEPALDETAPEEPALEEPALEEPGLEETAPVEPGREETIPEERGLEETTTDVSTSEADAIDKETTDDAIVAVTEAFESEDVPPEESPVEDDQTTVTKPEEPTETENTEKPAPTDKPKSTKRTKADAAERLQDTEHTPTSKNAKTKKGVDSASDVEDVDE